VVTSEKIAQLCGVTRGTVDRALNNRSGISPKTKENILRVSKELGYTPNFLARSLSIGVTYTIGVVLLDLHNQFFCHLLNNIEAEAKKHGYYIQIALSHKNMKDENLALEHFTNRKVDGIILYSVQHNSETFLKIQKAGIPMISIINRIEEKCGFIGIDNREAIRKLVKHLSDAGHKKIGYISHPLDLTGKVNQYALIERYQGFIEAMAELNIPIDENNVLIEVSLKEGLNKIFENSITDRSSLPTAFVCIDDQYAIETIRFLKKSSIKVPEDISIVGFDNIQAANLVEPSLTTIEYPIEYIAEKAVNYIVQAAEKRKFRDKTRPKDVDEDITEIILPAKMIIRESVKKLY